METTPNLALPYVMAAQAQKHVTHNEAIRRLDAVVQLAVLDRGRAEPPLDPAEGDRHIVVAEPAGAWTGRGGCVAALQDGEWVFLSPRAGWIAWIADEKRLVAWDGAAWVAAGGEVNPVGLVGVNATADVTNRLTVRSSASLFIHEGGGHQVKVSKAAPGDTASLLYQTDFSGRAEMGLAGDDNFHVKVSADGAAWKEAVVIEKDGGRVGFGAAEPQARVHCRVTAADGGRAFLMTGQGITGTDDVDHGVTLVLSHNISGNRQFTLADSESGLGIRVMGNQLDGYNYRIGTREDLTLATDTTDVRVRRHLLVAGWVQVGAYTVATLPGAAAAGAIAFVSDEAGGATLAFCDGTHWRRVSDRALVS